MSAAPVPQRYLVVLWLTAGGFAFIFCLYHLSATLVGGVFLPADHDSFYHARRILDALDDPPQMYQFDARIHAPEGSWVTWPWAYDMAMAFATRALTWLTGFPPINVLVFLAPAWVFVNAALFLGIASRLGLSFRMRVLAMLFFTVLPSTQSLHRVGMLDHHFLEWTFVLATIYLGLGWFGEMTSRRRSVALGVLLGAAPAFQNGLFILQLPVLMTLAWLWALRRPIDRRATLAFAAALLVATALCLLPSEPFRRGEFSFYLHSWFHLYIASCTALLCVLASRLRCSPASAVAAIVAALALAAPIVPQIELGRDFLFTRIPFHDRIGELGSVPRDVAEGRLWRLTLSYTALLWLLPISLLGLAWRLRRESNALHIYFVVHALFGSFLLLQTFRLHYFGTFALIFPLCLLIDDALRTWTVGSQARWRTLALQAVPIVLVLPSLLALLYRHPVGADYQYMLTRTVYPFLQEACRRAPGVVLAEHGDGHYIRYHSECSVIADNFITTPQHVEKIRLTEELFASPLAVVRQRAPYVRYLFVRRGDNVMDEEHACSLDCPENAGLRRELLGAEPESLPGLKMLIELRYQRRKQTEIFGRLFEVQP